MKVIAKPNQKESEKPFLTYSDNVEKIATEIAIEVGTSANRLQEYSNTIVTSGNDMYRYVLEGVILKR
jgi:hypothetical protein